jgi:hypothetical protein
MFEGIMAKFFNSLENSKSKDRKANKPQANKHKENHTIQNLREYTGSKQTCITKKIKEILNNVR